jgi:hypothetical protein
MKVSSKLAPKNQGANVNFIQKESSIVLKTLHNSRGLKPLIRLIVCAIMFRNYQKLVALIERKK